MHARARLDNVVLAGAIALAAAACADDGAHPPVATDLGYAPIGNGSPVDGDVGAEGQGSQDWAYAERNPALRGARRPGGGPTSGAGYPRGAAGTTGPATPNAAAASDGAAGAAAPARGAPPPIGGGGFGIGGGSGVGTGRGSGEGVSGGAGLGASGGGGGTANVPVTPPGGLSGIGGTDVGTGRDVSGPPGGAALGASGSGGQDFGTGGPSGNSAPATDPTPPGSIPNRGVPARDAGAPRERIDVEFF